MSAIIEAQPQELQIETAGVSTRRLVDISIFFYFFFEKSHESFLLRNQNSLSGKSELTWDEPV